MTDARKRLDGKATDAIYRARDAGLMMHDAGAAMVDEVLAHPDDLIALLVETRALTPGMLDDTEVDWFYRYPKSPDPRDLVSEGRRNDG